MDEQAANASDQAKAIVSIILMLGSCILIVGIIPAAIVVTGFLMARRHNNFVTIITTTRWTQWLIGAAGTAGTISVGYNNYYFLDKISAMILWMTITSMWIIILEYLWMRPMTRIIEDSSKQSRATSSSTDIIKRDSLATYSVADELRKWRDLRDDGTVTEDEYLAARSRIME